MCYDDGSRIAMQSYCPDCSGTIDESYDCGKDDYYAPAAPAGSYLDTHWNVYNSAFMASCASVAPAVRRGRWPDAGAARELDRARDRRHAQGRPDARRQPGHVG
jgi:hypothetical protein